MRMKMTVKMKNRSHRYDMNKPRSRHGLKCSKYEKRLTLVMVICIKQHEKKFMKELSNTEAELLMYT